MNRLQFFRLSLLLACLSVSTVSHAAESKPSFAFDAKLGYVSDSNVGIADLDTNSGAGDTARTYGLALKASLPVPRQFATRFGYDYSDTAYQELSQFDLGLHHLFAEVTWKPSLLDAGINAESFKARLDGDNYLDLVQVTPSISRLIGNRVYLRGAFTHADKRYEALPERDAANDAWRADMYMLIDNMDHYIALGIQSSVEDAADPAFDYRSLRWNMTYGQTVAVAARDLKLKVSLSNEGRRYTEDDESIDGQRRDMRLRFRVGADWMIFEHIGLAAHVEYTDIRSNLESAALDKTVFGLALDVRF
jgi:hypothetical protein